MGDARAIAEVHVHTWQAAYRGQVPDSVLKNLSIEDRTRAWSQIIGRSVPPASAAFVLESDGELLGFAHVAASRDEDASGEVGEVTAIYVSRSLWRSGAGSLLMHSALAALRAAGFSQATLWVLEANQRARRFYEATGWNPDGAVKVEQRDGFQLLELRYRRYLDS